MNILEQIYYQLSITINRLLNYFCDAAYSGLGSKPDRIVNFGLFLALMSWFTVNTLAAYSVYFNSSNMAAAMVVFQVGAVVMTTCSLLRWVAIVIARKQRDGAPFRFRMDRLTAEEQAALPYVLAPIIAAIVQWIYALTTGEISWQSQSSTGLLVHMAITYVLHMAMIRKFISFRNPVQRKLS